VGEFVRLEVEDGVGTIRLERPPMNALSAQVQEEIRAAAQEATERADVRAVVVYGGPKVFAAGADVKEMAGWSYQQMVDRSAALQSAFTAVARIPKPVIAAVTGFALGGGCELALCCDLRVAGDNAKLGQPEILLGIIPGAGGTQRLPRLVGPSRAKELIFTGRFVGAEEALRIGLVDLVVAPDDVYRAVALAPAGRGLASRCARQRRRSTAGSRSTSRPGWRSSACSSRRCSRRRTARSACSPSSSTARARPSSSAAERPDAQ
jgi:enoyl-CoA hydratase/carnithine racemase